MVFHRATAEAILFSATHKTERFARIRWLPVRA